MQSIWKEIARFKLMLVVPELFNIRMITVNNFGAQKYAYCCK